MKIGVLGLGLIGGSIFKKLQELANHEVVGVSSSVEAESVFRNMKELASCDVVFVCTPMNVTLEILEKLDKILPAKTIVTDVCSLKGFLCNKKFGFNFIPSHPMAGTEHSGWEYSFPELFKDAKWVITPIDGEITDGQEVLENIIESMGAKVVITTPDEHDRAVALISNLPLVVAQALCMNIKDNKLAQHLAASGFRDTTRLALSNLEMANDMLEINRENILASVDILKESLEKLLCEDYKAKAKSIKDFRQNLF